MKENESLPKINFSKLVKNYSRWKKKNKKRSLKSKHLFSLKIFNTSREQSINCNIDLSLYKHSIYLIGQGNSSVNLFGLDNKKGGVFRAMLEESQKEEAKEVEEARKELKKELYGKMEKDKNGSNLMKPMPMQKAEELNI